METATQNMDALLNELMKLGWLGVVVFLFIFAIYQYFNADGKKNVKPVEPEPGDDVQSMPYQDDGE